MKGKMRKLVAFMLATIMVLAMGMTVMAQDVPTGKGGSASITILNPKVGKTYTLYKIFNATETGSGENLKIAYTLLPGMNASDLTGTGFTADANGYVTAPEGMELNAGNITALTALATGGKGEKIGEPVESEGTKLVFSGLEYGYYLVQSDSGAAVSIDSTTPDMVIYDKNPSAPTIPEGGGKKVEGSDSVAIGETINYTLTFNTTNYETTKDDATGTVTNTKILEYTIEDTLPAWLGNVVIDSVKAGGTSIDVTDNQFATSKKLTIPWVDADENHLYPDGAVLEVKYHATVLESVEVAAKNTNEVKLTWTGNPAGITDEEDVYTGSITVLKYALNKEDSADQSAVLSGAQFVVLDKAVGEDGQIPTGANFYKVGADGKIETTTDITDATVLTTNENGTVTIRGLKPGETYYLLETVAPEGYNKLVGTTAVTIPAMTENPDAVALATLAQTRPIANSAGVELPSTGGIGTTIFYVVGGILVAAAGILLITKKRMSGRD